MVRPALLAAAATLATAHAQPVAVSPTDTAFPALAPPPGRPDVPALYARLRAAADRPLPPDAAPAAVVRCHRLKAAATHLPATHAARFAIRCEPPEELADLVRLATDAYRAAAAAEPDAAGRVALFAERVRVLRELERTTAARVTAGAEPPVDLDYIRFHRLAAEAELLTRTADGTTPRPRETP